MIRRVAMHIPMHPIRSTIAAVTLISGMTASADEIAQKTATREQAISCLNLAAHFFHEKVATYGGYVWRYSSDLRHRQGEGLAYDNRIWIQPPGTPIVGLAFLKAYRVTGNSEQLAAARQAAEALVLGQLHSGGWQYSVTFDPQKRGEINYRKPPTKGKPIVLESDSPGGWAVWKRRRYAQNKTVLDDDTTQSALRLLMQLDQTLAFSDQQIHEAVQYGLASLLKTQYPIGAWSSNYDRFPRDAPSERAYPVMSASYPQSWSRVSTNDFQGCYTINDRITLTAIETMLDAHAIYQNQEYLDSAILGGDFLLRAQMPEPQPAWAQSYDQTMQPVWDRAFEPPAITSLESQHALDTLLLLYQRTGARKYLNAVPKALAYLRHSRLKDGKLARFYELKSNRPIYLTKNHKLSYEVDPQATHYQFVVNSRLDSIALRYRILASDGHQAKLPTPTREELTEEVARIVSSIDQRGAWTEAGWVRDEAGKKITPADGIIRSSTFANNVDKLSQFIEKTK